MSLPQPPSSGDQTQLALVMPALRMTSTVWRHIAICCAAVASVPFEFFDHFSQLPLNSQYMRSMNRLPQAA